MARKKKGGHAEEHENAERWLLTYADMITLLMAFFIMMYSMSVLNMEKFSQVAVSIRSGFGGMLQGGKSLLEKPSGAVTDRTVGTFAELQALNRVESKMKDMVVSEQLEEKMQVQHDSRGLVISLASDEFLFPEGSAQLTPQSTTLLGKIAAQLKTTTNSLLIEGHTCNTPISTAVFPSNWELSSARACRVVRFLETVGLPQKRLTAVGYGDTRPRRPNDTAEHRSQNRRVDIVVLSETQPAKQGKSSSSTDNNEKSTLDVGIKPRIGKVVSPSVKENLTNE